jgi:hypothetical protein
MRIAVAPEAIYESMRMHAKMALPENVWVSSLLSEFWV